MFEPGQSFTAKVYLEVLRNLITAVRNKRLKLHNEGWCLLHDNALAHTAHDVLEFLDQNNIDILSILAPCDFLLF